MILRIIAKTLQILGTPVFVVLFVGFHLIGGLIMKLASLDWLLLFIIGLVALAIAGAWLGGRINP